MFKKVQFESNQAKIVNCKFNVKLSILGFSISSFPMTFLNLMLGMHSIDKLLSVT